MQLGRIVRDYDRARREAVAFLSSRIELDEQPGEALVWTDGPTLADLANHLSEELGFVTIEQRNYLGAPYVLNPNRRSTTITVTRNLSLLTLVATVLRCWGANGPLSTETPELASLLVSVAEQGGNYPIPDAMAHALLATTTELQAEPRSIIEAIQRAGYERLWAIGFSVVQ
ncbi:MAG: hypothetical protein ACYCWN_10700 [Ferrimicrobium sp.]|uniref:Uncharacterized protein n=1 Tax=Ferrimicrobium acidiphilum TaxID=121039 RepID=A0ABV3XZ56_9ACTN